MATKRNETGANIDWYLISIDRLKQIGLIVLLLLLAGAGYWFWQNQKGNPKTNAESAIEDARQALNALAASADFNVHRSEFNRAQQKLDEATSQLAKSRFQEARDAAVESQTISRAALSGGEMENDAQFLTVEGRVEYQKGSSSEWKDADPRTPLVNGDWVKTGDRSSAELIFSNGSLYTVGPNALLEIYAAVNPATRQKTNAVQMRVGSVEVATANDSSAVHTAGTQVVVDSESTTQVGFDKDQQTTAVVATRGGAEVRPASGGAAVRLAIGEKVSSNPQGVISPVKKLTMPPALLSPGDNQVFQLSSDLKVELMWDAREGASGYLLQVSRSRLFSTQEINTKRSKTSALARVTSEGAFYWRVAAVGPDGDVGPFSTFRRFRVSGGNKPTSDRTAPALTLKVPFHVGGQYYTIAGSTEPGATVFINDEEVDVESSGAFQKLIAVAKVGRNTIVIKAVDAAGNQTVQSQTVIVEE
ncbi:MAG: FecR domain-containing protein [Acidobacteriota bacterium]|nr:FecR domain-containing protein [Acidobacteriota bacterium]